MRTLVAVLFCLLLAAPLDAQKEKREPLTDAQQDQIAEAGIDPVARVNLYVKFLNEHADTYRGFDQARQVGSPAPTASTMSSRTSPRSWTNSATTSTSTPIARPTFACR